MTQNEEALNRAGPVQQGIRRVESDVLKMRGKHQTMWDGHLRKISVAKHRIDLSLPEAAFIHVARYLASPLKRVSKKKRLIK